MLCGECKDGYGPAVYSLDLKCANCSSLWSGYAISLYVFLQFPTTFIFMCLVIFRFNITSGPLLGYVVFCQAAVASLNYRKYVYDYIQTNTSPHLRYLFLFSVATSQFWTLQFLQAVLPPFCISEKLTGIQVHMLNFIPVTYSLVLVVISCILMELHAKNYRIVKILWRPFKTILSKVNITAVTSDGVFRALASFIFLSNISVLSATYQVGGSISIYNSIGVFQRKVIYTDPTTDWPSHKSTTYVLITAVPFISVSLIPSLLLCIYPTRVYRYLSRFLSARKRLAITAFAEALHSCFKDGLNGTRDYRGLAGATVFLILGIVVVERIINLLFNFSALITGGVMWLILVCVVSYVKPCKSALANISLVFHMTLLGALTYAIHLWEYDFCWNQHT